jgi:hypothetical protein
VTAQFLSVDPEVRVTLSPYGYAGDDPIDATDPTGNCGLSGNDSCFGDALNWTEHNFGTAASIGAAAACVVVTVGTCGSLVAGAFVLRSAQRWIYDGGSASVGSDLLDGFVTGSSFGLVSMSGAIALGETSGGVDGVVTGATGGLSQGQVWMAKGLLGSSGLFGSLVGVASGGNVPC